MPTSCLEKAPLVVVVGSVNADYLFHVARRPAAGETVTDAVLEMCPGGKGANQALASALSGAEVELVARVGNDSNGARRVQELTSLFHAATPGSLSRLKEGSSPTAEAPSMAKAG